MKQNINQLIFSRIAPQKKLKAIEKLTIIVFRDSETTMNNKN